MPVLSHAALAEHTLTSLYGPEAAGRALRSLRRLSSRSRNQWPWMRRFSTDELVLVAVTALAVDPDAGLLRAWAEASSWAYRMAEVRGGQPQTIPVGLTVDPLTWVDSSAGDPDLELLLVEPVDFEVLNPAQQELIAMGLAGMTWPEQARLLGRSPYAIAYSYRRAVHRLLDGNPHLAVRFGLRPCPTHSSDSGWCRDCKGYGWLGPEGRPINDPEVTHA